MTATTIRLSLNSELKTILDDIKRAYPLLEYPEILRMALSSYYQRFQEQQIREQEASLSVRETTPREEQSIAKGQADINKGHFATIKSGDTEALRKFLGTTG